jgi:hypothetical protein
MARTSVVEKKLFEEPGQLLLMTSAHAETPVIRTREPNLETDEGDVARSETETRSNMAKTASTGQEH